MKDFESQKTTLPFKVLEGLHIGKCEMAERSRRFANLSEHKIAYFTDAAAYLLLISSISNLT